VGLLPFLMSDKDFKAAIMPWYKMLPFLLQQTGGFDHIEEMHLAINRKPQELEWKRKSMAEVP
ncbi:hypothetical protein TorRG33x02_351770, partial [Trema orientale]